MPKLVGLRRYFHQNVWSQHPVFVAKIDLSDTPDVAPGTLDVLIQYLPTRLPRAADMGEGVSVAEIIHWITRSLQNYHDVAPPFSEISVEAERQLATITYAYGDPQFGQSSAQLAVRLVHAALTEQTGGSAGIYAMTDRVLGACDRMALDQTTKAMVREIGRRGIPWRRESHRIIFTGQGANSRTFMESRPGDEGWVWGVYANDKLSSLRAFHQGGVPVGKFATALTVAEALGAAETIGFPLVIKPVDGGKGTDVYPDIKDAKILQQIAERFEARKIRMLLQTHFAGDDYRILVVDGKFIAAAKRIPASVAGDGRSTIAELIERTNDDPDRGKGFTRLLCRIEIDDALVAVLVEQGFSLSHVPPENHRVWLKKTANIHTGGMAEDVTDIIHPDNIRMAERAARKARLSVAGVDFLTTDISRSWREIGGGVCEINASPGPGPHWIGNPNRDIISPIVDVLFKDGSNGRVPTAVVAGTIGVTTTSQILAQILKTAGHTPGVASTEGIFVGLERIHDAGTAGPNSSEIVLSDPDVTAAVLETTHHEMVERGLYLDRCDVAAVLNVHGDQPGASEKQAVEGALRAMKKVIDSAEKAAILNLDDPLTAALASDCPPERVIGFSTQANSAAVETLLQNGGAAVVFDGSPGGEQIVIISPNSQGNVTPIAKLQTAAEAQQQDHIANVLAATGLAYGMGVSLGNISAGLSDFGMPPAD